MSFQTDLDTPAEAVTARNADTLWIRWGIWSTLSLAIALFAVIGLGFDTGLLLGWAIGIIVAATLILFRRR